jgi:phosphate transporter
LGLTVPQSDENVALLLDIEAIPTEQPATPFARKPIEEANLFFSVVLDEELKKIVKFYTKKESELINQLNQIEEDIRVSEQEELRYLSKSSHQPFSPMSPSQSPAYLSTLPVPPTSPVIPSQALASLNESIASSGERPTIRSMPSGYFVSLMWASADLKHKQSELKLKLVDLYVALNELNEYVEINETGFRLLL